MSAACSQSLKTAIEPRSKLLPTCRFEAALCEYLHVPLLLFLSVLSFPLSSRPWFYIPFYTLMISKSIPALISFLNPRFICPTTCLEVSLCYSHRHLECDISRLKFFPQTPLDQAKNWLFLAFSSIFHIKFFRNFSENISQTWLWPSSLMVQVTIFSHLDYSVTF